ncbi:aKG-HExxH-type peptide beta-hydroxylase [Streptomyces sp. NPDC059009]|uniref:aKG-HExxH-type peptide beta-hydroxylase n=1 Tax=Streptomyces sp. NPDC059009 TaxID=3346694 RepID=UPI0036759C8D
MTPGPFSAAVFVKIARTRPVPVGALALHAGVHARRMLLLKSLLARIEHDAPGGAVAPEARRRFERDWALLEQAERTHPMAARDVIDYPLTGSWLAAALTAPDGPAFERHLDHLGGLALAAAIRAGCRHSGTRDLPAPALALPGIGVLHCPSRTVHFDIRPGLSRLADDAGRHHAELPGSGTHTSCPGPPPPPGEGPGWSALRTLPGSGVVLDDLDPYRGAAATRAHDAYPQWARCWQQTQDLLTATDPARAAEIRATLRVIVPMPSDGPGSTVPMSGTLRAAPRAVLARLPAGEQDMAESLVHEIHHTKLAVLHDITPLYRRVDGAVHRVGWRPDPRPLAGVLQGAYAHLALTDLWHRSRDAAGTPESWRRRAAERLGTLWEQVGEALSILLESDELTVAGREFTTEMARCHARLGVAHRIRG